MSKYPESITKYKPKGCIIKKNGNKYYVYKATSKRVEGKKYPVQVIEGLIGEIDEFGFHELHNARVNTTSIQIKEYGFTNYLLMFEDEYISRNKVVGRTIKDSRHIYHSIICYLSPMSYLHSEEDIETVEILAKKYNIGLPNQINSIEKIVERSIESLERLKYICLVKMGNRKFYSDLTENQEKIIKELGVEIDELRNKR